jgi:hypothetical protein
MPAEILSIKGSDKSTSSYNQKKSITFTEKEDFPAARTVRILSITSSGWVLSTRNSAEGGSRNSVPKVWVTLHGRNQDVIGPIYYPIEFDRVDGLTVNLELPHFFIADTRSPAEWYFDVTASCYYEFT